MVRAGTDVVMRPLTETEKMFGEVGDYVDRGVGRVMNPSEQIHYYLKIKGLPKEADYNRLPFGRQIDYRRDIENFKASARHGYVDSKRKSYAAGLKEFLKLYQADQWYAVTRGGPNYHDDSFEIWYTAKGESENPKPPSEMTAGEINKALDRLDKLGSANTEAFIAAGRGNERPSDYLGNMDDPLSRKATELWRLRMAYRNEVERRYGPGAPSRLPKGFGPLKRNPARESDILYERGAYWVTKTRNGFEIFKNGVTHSTSVGEAYPDVSLAVARVNYLAKRDEGKKNPTGPGSKWLLPFKRNKKNYEDVGYLPFALEHDIGFSGNKMYRPVKVEGGHIIVGSSELSSVEFDRYSRKSAIEAIKKLAGGGRNPAVSASQYGLAQAVLSGRSKAMSKKVARELVDKTPAHLRSEFAGELAERRGNPDWEMGNVFWENIGGRSDSSRLLNYGNNDVYGSVKMHTGFGSSVWWVGRVGQKYSSEFKTEQGAKNWVEEKSGVKSGERRNPIQQDMFMTPGQGHDADYDKNPYNEILLKYGYRYTHSTPVRYRDGSVAVHHAYNNGKDHFVGVYKRHGGWHWEAHRGGSGHRYSSVGAAPLEKYLKTLQRGYKGKVKKNPESGAVDMYESFHGKPSEEILEFIEDERYHGNLAGLGTLTEAKVITPSGYDVTLSFDYGEGSDAKENGFWSKLKRLISKGKSTWINYDSAPTESAAHRIAGDLEARGVRHYKVQHDKKKGVWHVNVLREGLRALTRREHGSTGSTSTKSRPGKAVTYKGVKIVQTASGFSAPKIDRDTTFDTVEDARDFVDSTRNPSGFDLHIGPRRQSFGSFDAAYRAGVKAAKSGVHSKFTIENVVSGERREFTRSGAVENPQAVSTKTVLLCSNEDGTQLYFVGGDQSINLKSIHMDGRWERDSMVLGVIYEVTYRTEKKFDKFKLTDYYHRLGEETKEEPTLRYDKLNEKLYIDGGQYKIKKPLIGMSPGIEN